jgi:hypothetical protein
MVPSGSSVGLKMVISRPTTRPPSMASRSTVSNSAQLSPPGSEQVAEQDRAVAAEHDRELAPVENLTGRRGEQMGVVAKPCRVEHPNDAVTPRVVGRRAYTSTMARPSPSAKPAASNDIVKHVGKHAALAWRYW